MVEKRNFWDITLEVFMRVKKHKVTKMLAAKFNAIKEFNAARKVLKPTLKQIVSAIKKVATIKKIKESSFLTEKGWDRGVAQNVTITINTDLADQELLKSVAKEIGKRYTPRDRWITLKDRTSNMTTEMDIEAEGSKINIGVTIKYKDRDKLTKFINDTTGKRGDSYPYAGSYSMVPIKELVRLLKKEIKPYGLN